MTDQGHDTQRSVCLQCKSLWQEIVSRWDLGMFEKKWPYSWQYKWFCLPGHHQTLIELRNSARDGCLLCSLLWQAGEVKTLHGVENLLQTSYSLRLREFYFGDASTALVAVVAPKEVQENGNLTLHGVRLLIRSWRGYSQPDALWTNSLRRRDCSTASDACFEMARTWLTSCVTTHMPCSLAEGVRKVQRGRFTPRRLLRLYVEGTRISIQLLSKAKALDPPPVYMTLSHCWGQKKPFMLNEHNMPLLEGGVELEKLPRTYADAVVITTQMG